jgi:hypothetical protein
MLEGKLGALEIRKWNSRTNMAENQSNYFKTVRCVIAKIIWSSSRIVEWLPRAAKKVYNLPSEIAVNGSKFCPSGNLDSGNTME